MSSSYIIVNVNKDNLLQETIENIEQNKETIDLFNREVL